MLVDTEEKKENIRILMYFLEIGDVFLTLMGIEKPSYIHGIITYLSF